MKRIDRIRALTVSEMAELIIESNYIAEENLNFVQTNVQRNLTQTFR